MGFFTVFFSARASMEQYPNIEVFPEVELRLFNSSSIAVTKLRRRNFEDMMYYTPKFHFQANQIVNQMSDSPKLRTKTRYEMHKTEWYIDLRIAFTHSFEHEIPNLVFNLVSLEKKFGAIVSWVLK